MEDVYISAESGPPAMPHKREPEIVKVAGTSGSGRPQDPQPGRAAHTRPIVVETRRTLRWDDLELTIAVREARRILLDEVLAVDPRALCRLHALFDARRRITLKDTRDESSRPDRVPKPLSYRATGPWLRRRALRNWRPWPSSAR